MKLIDVLPTPQAIVRLLFFREFGHRVEEAINFVLGLQSNTFKTTIDTTGYLADGVYFCLTDGTVIPFDNQTSVENVDHIGIVVGANKFGVTLKDKGDYQLYKDYNQCPEKADYYANNHTNVNCHEESDFIEATKRIQRIGTDIPLNKDEYLPLVRQFDCMGMFKSQLQKALVAAGGEPLSDDEWYTTASEGSQNYAWGVSFSSGNTSNNVKYNSSRVRAVVAF